MELKRGWKIKQIGNGAYEYREYLDGKSRSIIIEGEQYVKGQPRHVIYLRKDWDNYPEWTHDRKDTIISRLKEEFKEPMYTFVERE